MHASKSAHQSVYLDKIGESLTADTESPHNITAGLYK